MCEIVASNTIQAMFAQLSVKKPSISSSTAHHWLAKLNWKYGKRLNGMYIDGHE
jgi:hypothetical protein